MYVLELSVSDLWPKKYSREDSEKSQITSHAFDSLLGMLPVVICSSFFSFPDLAEVFVGRSLLLGESGHQAQLWP